MTTFDYFIATKYRNKASALEVANKIREKGKTVYCFVESQTSLTHMGATDEDPEAAMKAFESINDWRTNPIVKDIFEADMEALKASNTIVVLLPAGKSVHIESGVAYGLGKNLILVGNPEETESLYLIFNEYYATVDEFIEHV